MSLRTDLTEKLDYLNISLQEELTLMLQIIRKNYKIITRL